MDVHLLCITKLPSHELGIYLLLDLMLTGKYFCDLNGKKDTPGLSHTFISLAGFMNNYRNTNVKIEGRN